MVPALICFIVKTLLSTVRLMAGNADMSALGQSLRGSLWTLLYASGNDIVSHGIEIEKIGVIWFLFVLFFSRVIFDGLQLLIKKKAILFIITASLCVLGFYLPYLFFSFDITLMVLVLFSISHIARDHFDPEKNTAYKLLLFFVIWSLFLLIPYLLPEESRPQMMNMAGRIYPLFPLCFIGAISATGFFCCVSVYLSKLGQLTNALCYIGRNTLYLMIVHYFDGMWFVVWGKTSNPYITGLLRLICDLIVFLVFMLCRRGFKVIHVRFKSEKG